MAQVTLIQSVRAHQLNISPGDIGLWLVALIPWLLGWTTGALVWALDVLIAGFRAGYERGRG